MNLTYEFIEPLLLCFLKCADVDDHSLHLDNLPGCLAAKCASVPSEILLGQGRVTYGFTARYAQSSAVLDIVAMHSDHFNAVNCCEGMGKLRPNIGQVDQGQLSAVAYQHDLLQYAYHALCTVRQRGAQIHLQIDSLNLLLLLCFAMLIVHHPYRNKDCNDRPERLNPRGQSHSLDGCPLY